MILCEDVQWRNPARTKADVMGLISGVSSPTGSFPARFSFCVYLALVGGRGSGKAGIAVVDADTEETVYSSPQQTITFPNDPTDVGALVIRVSCCEVPEPGFYWVWISCIMANVSCDPRSK